jgi:hypothetical protein
MSNEIASSHPKCMRHFFIVQPSFSVPLRKQP